MANIDKYNKNSKADAKIEEKRRKNAARRAAAKAKTDADANANVGTGIDPPMSAGKKPGERTVYKDCANIGASGSSARSGSSSAQKAGSRKRSPKGRKKAELEVYRRDRPDSALHSDTSRRFHWKYIHASS